MRNAGVSVRSKYLVLSTRSIACTCTLTPLNNCNIGLVPKNRDFSKGTLHFKKCLWVDAGMGYNMKLEIQLHAKFPVAFALKVFKCTMIALKPVANHSSQDAKRETTKHLVCIMSIVCF